MGFMRWAVFFVCCGTATLVACGGGGSTTTPVASSSPSDVFTAVPQPMLSPFSVSEDALAVPVPDSTAVGAPQITLPIPSTAQVVSEMDLSAVGTEILGGTTVDISETNEALTGVPAPTGAVRASGQRTIESSAVKTNILIVTVAFSQTVTLLTRPTFVFTFPDGFLIAANYYLEYYDSSEPSLGWQDPFEGPATIDGNTLLFVDANHTFTFKARVIYFFDLYSVSTRATPTPIPATPTPVASPSPTASPVAGQLTVTPTSFSFDAAGQTETLVASEAGSTGAFTATINGAALGTITKVSSNTFTVTGGNSPGRSSVTVADGNGRTASVPFTVTITTGTISSHARH